MSRVPPQAAQLIRRHREALGISPEVAAERIKLKMSARRWRQIEAGQEYNGGVPVVANPSQLAHMSAVVGVEPEQLERIDQAEAAEILRVINAKRAAALEGAAGRPADLPEDIRMRIAELVRRQEEIARNQAKIARQNEEMASANREIRAEMDRLLRHALHPDALHPDEDRDVS